MNNKYVEVQTSFLNKKKQLKKVKLYIDERTYKAINDPSVSKEERERYLKEEYYVYIKEKKYYRKTTLLEKECVYEIKNDDEYDYLVSCLNEEEKQLMDMLYKEGLKQKDVSTLFCISKQAVSKKTKKILEKKHKKK